MRTNCSMKGMNGKSAPLLNWTIDYSPYSIVLYTHILQKCKSLFLGSCFLETNVRRPWTLVRELLLVSQTSLGNKDGMPGQDKQQTDSSIS